MPRFTPVRLLGVVTALGLAYALWHSTFGNSMARERARVCRVNRNLIDAYVLFWEARQGYLDAKRAYSMELDTAGAVASASPGIPLPAGSRAIAEAALDPEAFRCPEAPGGGAAVHYRWMMGPDPAQDLAGRLRGAVCLVHR